MDRYRVPEGQIVDLTQWDPNDRSAFDGSKREGRAHLESLRKRLAELQRLLWAESKHKVLVVFQAMDTGGKDGTIRHVFEGVNPQGVSVTSFGVPSEKELAHDYLWRVHKNVPKKGQVMIFNRSHYEDVLVVRVESLVPKKVWKKRYEHIPNIRLCSSQQF